MTNYFIEELENELDVITWKGTTDKTFHVIEFLRSVIHTFKDSVSIRQVLEFSIANCENEEALDIVVNFLQTMEKIELSYIPQ